MVYVARIVASTGDAAMTVVHLMRRYCWSADLEGERLPLAAFVVLCQASGISKQGSIALASLFDLTADMLGRPLEPQRLCAHQLSPDEQALLHLLGSDSTVSASPTIGTDMIPHGLPGALAWAVASVRSLCPDLVSDLRSVSRTITCPFMQAGQHKDPTLVSLS